MKPGFKWIYCFIVHKRLPSTSAGWTFFFHLKNIVWNLKTLVILEGFKHLEILELHGLCAQAALHGLETHLTEPALPRASGAAPPQDVLL